MESQRGKGEGVGAETRCQNKTLKTHNRAGIEVTHRLGNDSSCSSCQSPTDTGGGGWGEEVVAAAGMRVVGQPPGQEHHGRRLTEAQRR